MSRDDWFRNKQWNADIEARFLEKLGRAKRKAEYLSLQANELVETNPAVALKLLDRYFELGEHFHDASAYLDQSRAYQALGKTEDAIHSLQAALQRERDFPNLKTMAWSDFALLVAAKRLQTFYEEARTVLEEKRSEKIPMFPEQQFLWYAAHAMLDNATGRKELAKSYAVKAMEAANKTDSGLRYHPTAGLVGRKYAGLKKELARISGAQSSLLTRIKNTFRA